LTLGIAGDWAINTWDMWNDLKPSEEEKQKGLFVLLCGQKYTK
jgi:hypothetical protein